MEIPKMKGVVTPYDWTNAAPLRPNEIVVIRKDAFKTGAYSIHLTDSADESTMKSDTVIGYTPSKQLAIEFAKQVRQLNNIREGKVSPEMHKLIERVVKKVVNEEVDRVPDEVLTKKFKVFATFNNGTLRMDRNFKLYPDRYILAFNNDKPLPIEDFGNYALFKTEVTEEGAWEKYLEWLGDD